MNLITILKLRVDKPQPPDQDISNVKQKFYRLDANINKLSYFTGQTVRAFFSRTKLNILFTAQNERESDIKRSFKFLRHSVSFNEFTYEALAKSDLIVPFSLHDIRQINQYPELAKRNPIPIPALWLRLRVLLLGCFFA